MKIKLFLATLLLSGCTWMFDTDFMGYERTEDGKFADTPMMQKDSIESINRWITDERGKTIGPPGAIHTPETAVWNKFWLRRIKYLNQNQENPQKYINYIIKTRQAAGLPELVYDENTE